MSYQCKVLLDSISPTGKRLTTFEITFPRIVLAEFNTHRMFSRNSASSRAIPFDRQVQRVLDNPFIPEQFPLNCRGMQPQEYVTKESDPISFGSATSQWLYARDQAVKIAINLHEHSDIHKQIVNRLLEPFQYHTVICTATEFDNFFKLRTHPDAQFEIRKIADLMYEAYHAFDNESNNENIKRVNIFSNTRSCSERGLLGEINGAQWLATKQQNLKVGEWHCPLVYEEDEEQINTYIRNEIAEFSNSQNFSGDLLEIKKRISVARCARISYLTHDGKRSIEKDLELFEKLKISGHWSPFEHVASPFFVDIDNVSNSLLQRSVIDNDGNIRCGNFIGWKSFRKEFADENCTYFRKET